MAWDSDAIDILRTILFDLDEAAQRYSDDTLLSLAVAAAFQVVREVDFDADYVVNIGSQSISPEPDEALLNLLTLKAACIVDRGEATIAAGRGIYAKDDKAAIDLRGVAQARQRILDRGGWCGAYAEAKKDHVNAQAGISRTGATTAGQVVLSPFRMFARSYLRR